MFVFRYRSRFSLPPEVADFVCALALELGASPDVVLANIVRMWARANPGARKLAWDRAIQDFRRETWKPRPPPLGGHSTVCAQLPGAQRPFDDMFCAAGPLMRCILFCAQVSD